MSLSDMLVKRDMEFIDGVIEASKKDIFESDYDFINFYEILYPEKIIINRFLNKYYDNEREYLKNAKISSGYRNSREVLGVSLAYLALSHLYLAVNYPNNTIKNIAFNFFGSFVVYGGLNYYLGYRNRKNYEKRKKFLKQDTLDRLDYLHESIRYNDLKKKDEFNLN